MAADGNRLTIFTVPSHELEANVSFVTGLQATENVSRLCSWKFMTGNSGTLVSYSFTEPSPHATSSWFSLISDHARSYWASFVSKLQKRRISSCIHSAAWFLKKVKGKRPLDVRPLDLDTIRSQC